MESDQKKETFVKNKTPSGRGTAFRSCHYFSALLHYARRSLVRTALLGLCLFGSAFIFPAGAAPITWTNTSGGSWNVAANWSPNSVPGASDDVFITSNGTYTVTMDVSPTISRLTLGGISGQQTLTNTSQTLTLSLPSVVNTNGILGMNAGTLSGLGSLSINGQVHWNGGSSGNGFSVTVQSNAVLNLQAQVVFAGPVTNSGTVNWLAGGLFIQNNGTTATGEFWNQAGALFDIQCNQSVGLYSSFGNFHNAGVVRKEIVAGTTTFQIFFDNTGTVQAKIGTINFSTGSNLGGIFQADSGAAINFNGGTYTLSSPPNFQGPGTVQFTGGNLTLNAFTGTFTLNGIALVGQNTIAATGIINLNGTSLSAGGSLTVASNAVLNLQTAITFSGVLTNQGTVNWVAGNVTVNTNGSGTTGAIRNQAGALFDIQCDQTLNFNSLLATFNNAGSLRKSAGSNTTAITVKLDNTGTIQAQTGVIGIQGPYTESPAATLAISLSALTPGTGFGKIQFSVAPTFAGKFTLGTLNGYRPNPGNSFFVIGYPTAAGDFTSLAGLDLGSGLRLTPRFSASGLTLVAASYPVNPVPSLTLDRSGSGVFVAWPINFTGWQLQSTTNLASPSWVTVPVAGTNNTVVATGSQGYFRLFQ